LVSIASARTRATPTRGRPSALSTPSASSLSALSPSSSPLGLSRERDSSLALM
jgi:hypothetical protein